MRVVTEKEISQMVRDGKEFRIRAANSKHSERIQRAIFAGGGRWVSDSNGLVNYSEKQFYIFFKASVHMTVPRLFWLDECSFHGSYKKYDEISLFDEFKTQEQIWDFLKTGKFIQNYYDKRFYFALVDGFVVRFLSNGNFDGKYTSNFNAPEDWYPFTPEKHWYEELPEHAVACWVWDKNECVKIPAYVNQYCESAAMYKFGTVWGNWYINAQPMTEEELQQFIYKK